MSDLFISYSRDDFRFVEKLHKSIESDGRDAWLDCFDIPKGEKFWNEITQGINSADTFLFVLSPSSIEKAARNGQDAYCRREIEYAAQQGKRIIPVVYQSEFKLMDSVTAHQILSERNWIDFTRESEFSTKIQELVEAIKLDIDYVRQHTELTISSESWKKSNKKDRSLLWHGKRLSRAEKWLNSGNLKLSTESDDKYSSPLPTQLQREFITASIKFSRTRKLIFAASIIIPLFILEPYQREQSVREEFKRINSSNQNERIQAVKNLIHGCSNLKEWKKEFLFAGERIYGNCRSMANIDFSNLNLSGIGPSGGYTETVFLSHIDLSGGKLNNSILNGTYFQNSNFNDADLSNVKLGKSKLDNSKLFNVNLVNSDLSGSSLNDTKLVGANLENVNLSYADLYNADLEGARLINANLYNANLKNVTFKRAILDGSDLSRANLEAAKSITSDQLKSARICKTILPPNLSINPDRDCDLPLPAVSKSSKSISRTYTPQFTCRFKSYISCAITEIYTDGKWSKLIFQWKDQTKTTIIIDSINPGWRFPSTHGKARIDGQPSEYFSYNDGGICFRVLKDENALCYR